MGNRISCCVCVRGREQCVRVFPASQNMSEPCTRCSYSELCLQLLRTWHHYFLSSRQLACVRETQPKGQIFSRYECHACHLNTKLNTFKLDSAENCLRRHNAAISHGSLILNWWKSEDKSHTHTLFWKLGLAYMNFWLDGKSVAIGDSRSAAGHVDSVALGGILKKKEAAR